MLFSTEYAARRYAVFLRYPCINFGVLFPCDDGFFKQRMHPRHDSLIAENLVDGCCCVCNFLTHFLSSPWIFRSTDGNSIFLVCFDRTEMFYRRPDRCDLQGICSESDLNAQSTIADGTCHSRTFLPCVSVPEGFQRDIAYTNAGCF